MEALARKLMVRSGKKQKGMTLVELLAVIVILGIVAGIGTIAIGNIIKNQRTAADERKAEMIEEAARMYVLDTNVTADITINVTDLISKGYFDGDVNRASDDNVFTTVVVDFTTSGTDTTVKYTVNTDASGG